MGRRKRDNSFEVAKLVAVVVFLGAFALAGGNLKGAVALFVPLLLGLVILAAVGLVVFFLLKTGGNDSVRFASKVVNPPAFSPPVRARVTRDEDFAPRPEPLASVPEKITASLLDQLEWRRFEMLVEGLFSAKGRHASRLRAGADGGIDLVLRDAPDGPMAAIVQCKAWKVYSVGVKPVRELFGVMAAEGVPRGYFVTSGNFTSEARDFAKFKPLELIDGRELLERLNSLEDSVHQELLAKVTDGDYTTPTCPSCETKMVKRTSRYGEFWGCRSYPRCKQKFRNGE